MIRARSDQLLHVILERSLTGPSTMQMTNVNEKAKNLKSHPKNKIYPFLGSDSDLESVC